MRRLLDAGRSSLLSDTAALPSSFDPNDRWGLHPRVALRPEPFGALAYHYDNRRLNFVRSPALVALLKILADHESVSVAFDHSGVADARRPAFERALSALAASDFLQPLPELERNGSPG